MNKYVAYYRVSTARQGQSGLGLEAQQAAVQAHLKTTGAELVAELIEVESGKKTKRVQLDEAMKQCKKKKATLLIAKLDRLARNVHFISGLMESSVEFLALDMQHANRLTIHIMAAVAEDEAARISARTKAALQASKARGTELGKNGKKLAAQNLQAAKKRDERVIPLIHKLQDKGIKTLSGIARALNGQGVKTTTGKEWHAMTVKRLLKRNVNPTPH
ncbi:recombinase family protein [Rubritalea spongiae]|uniref:Recombinase family protein n=1 Tax=Rubritalea spongiae TaxID=430797 RepID=A0ABW5E569_9BACT